MKNKRGELKTTKKLKEELYEYNRFYRKPQHLRNLTIDEYKRYLMGKGLPDCKPYLENKPLQFKGIPDWAFNPNTIPSAKPSPDYVPETKDNSYKQEVSKQFTVAIAYSKGPYQVLRKEEIVGAGRKL